jgi:OmpA-OmpF porin, OOP family
MKRKIFLLFTFLSATCLYAQRKTPNDGDWSEQFLVLHKTAEADLMIRVGDIDNLSFTFEEGFDPFSGRSTPTHGYPWDTDPKDAKGTDRIFVPTSYKYPSSKASEGYAGSTYRPHNIPVSVSIPLAELKTVKIDSASLQLFVDDFQSPSYQSKFQFKLNGTRFPEAEKIINKIKQDGPVGKLITIRLTPEQLQKLSGDSLVIYIDDPTTGIGDGYAIDFVKLLINPKIIQRGKVQGKVIDAATREPIAGAKAFVDEFGSAITDNEGNFMIDNIPAGLVLVTGTANGYSAAQEQADIISGEMSEPVEIALKRSAIVTFNNIKLKEGDDLVMNNIQFNVNSAVLLPAGKQELDKLATLMKQKGSLEILLSGHTSSEGSPSLNRELSLKRVRSCKDYLISRGVDDGRITIKGFGPDKPVAPNDTEAGRSKNRRVEMMVTKLGE